MLRIFKRARCPKLDSFAESFLPREHDAVFSSVLNTSKKKLSYVEKSNQKRMCLDVNRYLRSRLLCSCLWRRYGESAYFL
jgi:hypothetical protein